jgi:hypothetical protein
LARSEEARKRRNEETEKRRREAEGFPGHLEPGSIHRSMIMSKMISLSFDSGKEAFQMARMRLLWLPTPWGPERLEPGSLYRLMIMSKNISHVVVPGKGAFQMARMRLLRPVTLGSTLWGPLLQELSERRHSDLFFFTRNRYDSNTAVVTIEKSLARMVKFPTYFFEPRRHTKGREEEKKRRNEETEKRRREAKSFQRYEAIIQILPFQAGVNTRFTPTIARKWPSDIAGVGTRPDFMFARTIGKIRIPGYKGNQLTVGSCQLARREVEGFPERLERDSLYQLMIISRNISHVIDPGKEAFQMVRRTLIGPLRYAPRRGVDPDKEVFWMARMGLFGTLMPGGGPGMQLLPFSGRTQGSPLRSPKAWYSGNKSGEGRGEPCVRPYPEFRWFLLFPGSFPGAAPRDPGRQRYERNQLAIGSRQLARREEMWKRRNEETKKRSREAKGFHEFLERSSLYKSMIMSKEISFVVVPGKEAFHMYEGNQLARREEVGKRRNEETEIRRREAEGFPKHLEPGSIYRSLIISKNISHVADPGKEVFQMARMGLFEKFLEVSEPFYKKVLIRRRHKANDTNTAGLSFKKSLDGEEGISKMNRHAPLLEYFIPHQAFVKDRNQSLEETGKPGFPAMDARDKITGEHAFGNHGSPGITGISQQQGPNIDIDQLTDRVYRVLEDKIRMEKEMRGW